MLESSRRNLLPKSEIPKFGGDITKYHSFIRAFDAKIGNRSMDCEEKLHFLEQFTSGRPRQIVQACFHMEPDQGYAEARRLLEKRYGDPSKVATAYTEKLLDWPIISADDVQGLDEMALYARGCFNAVKALEDSSELDHHKTLRMLVEKLPFHLQEQWRREVDAVSEHKKRRVAFSDFVEFIETEARVASNSEFGRHVFKKTTRRGDVQRVKCNRTSPEEKEVCLLCSQEHALESCQAFANRPLAARQEFVRQSRLCFGCLKFGHFSRSCPHRLTCSVCSGKHPSVMHVFRTAGAENQQQRQEAQLGMESAQPSVSVRTISSSDGSMKMPMIPVKVQYRDGPPIVTYMFLDSGSSSTFCTYDLLSKLNVDVRNKTKLSVSTMSKDPLVVWASAVQGLSISDMSENNQVTLPTVFALDKIPASREEICTAEDLQDWPHLQEVVPDVVDAEIGMLVGMNVPEALEPTDFIQSRDSSPYAVRTRLGWVVNGPVRKQKWAEMRATANRIKVEVQGFQVDENPASEERGWSVEDHKWMEKIDKEAKMDGGHYELPIPLKSDDTVLPDNREVCLRRLQGLGKKFQNESFADRYCEVIEDMAKKGYAEKVPEDELGRADGLVNYLPHHEVFGKKDKLRVVFDCSSSFRGFSLNDMVFQGPSLCTPLIDVLTRFRQEEEAFMGDVNAMFHQVHVPSGHRDLLRYLWWRDGDPAEEVETWRMKVHPFGLKSSPSCASYALLRTASDFGEEVSPEAAQTVISNMYVDDLVKSVADVDQALRLVKKVRELCEKGGFHMAKFVSNRREVLDSIPPEDRGKKVKDLDFDDDLPSERTLGIEWHMESDTIGFATKATEKPPTRRGMLSVIGSVYDPLGMAAPFVLNGRIILQELVRRQYRWDEPAPEDLIVKWQEWLTGISLISDVCISRCVKPVEFGTAKDCQLHHFADASNEGYGVVSYLRMTNARGEVHCAFLFGKSRLAPLKSMTVPRLELAAATLAARTDVLLRRALQTAPSLL